MAGLKFSEVFKSLNAAYGIEKGDPVVFNFLHSDTGMENFSSQSDEPNDTAFSTGSIPVHQHFSTPGHNFTTHARITLIVKIENTTYMTEEEVTTFLETREDFWMIKLDTLIPD